MVQRAVELRVERFKRLRVLCPILLSLAITSASAGSGAPGSAAGKRVSGGSKFSATAGRFRYLCTVPSVPSPGGRIGGPGVPVPSGLAYAGGDRLLVMDEEGPRLRVYDLKMHRWTSAVSVPPAREEGELYHPVGVGPGGDVLVGESLGGRLFRYEAGRGVRRVCDLAETGRLWSVRPLSAGHALVTVSKDRYGDSVSEVRVVDLSIGKPIATAPGHEMLLEEILPDQAGGVAVVGGRSLDALGLGKTRRLAPPKGMAGLSVQLLKALPATYLALGYLDERKWFFLRVRHDGKMLGSVALHTVLPRDAGPAISGRDTLACCVLPSGELVVAVNRTRKGRESVELWRGAVPGS